MEKIPPPSLTISHTGTILGAISDVAQIFCDRIGSRETSRDMIALCPLPEVSPTKKQNTTACEKTGAVTARVRKSGS